MKKMIFLAVTLVTYANVFSKNSVCWPAPVPVDQAFQESLDYARQLRREGQFRDAGITLNSLAQRVNVGGTHQNIRPSLQVARQAQAELTAMRAAGQWDESMLAYYRGND